MRVVPEGPRVCRFEDVAEASSRRYGALRDDARTVHPGSVCLRKSVPVNAGRFSSEHIFYVYHHGLALVHHQCWSVKSSVDPDERAIRESVGCVGLSAVGSVATCPVREEWHVHQFPVVVDVVRLSAGAKGRISEVAGECYESLDCKLEVADVAGLGTRAGGHIFAAEVVAGLTGAAGNQHQ